MIHLSNDIKFVYLNIKLPCNSYAQEVKKFVKFRKTKKSIF